MIVSIILEDNSDDEVEQEIYCNDPCYPNFKGYLSNFNIYTNSISDFISADYEEYCHSCTKQLNIFDEDLQQFRPRTETDNEIVKSINFKGKAINFKRLI